MERLDRAVVRLNAALHYAAALWLFGLAVVILLDVAGRGLFNAPLQKLLVMGAQTCYLHAALRSALEPQIEIVR